MLQTQELESQATESYPGTQAVARAIGLLKTFSDAQPEWSLGDLAQVTRLNKTTAFRLLAALEAEGLVMRNPLSGGYRLGVELVALGGCAMRANPLRAVSRPVLEALAQECDEAATLEVLAGSHVLIVDEVSSRHPMGMSQDVGSRLPAHATATGKLLLAYAPAGGERGPGAGADTGIDTGLNTGLNTGLDTGFDAGGDARRNAGNNTRRDTGRDAGRDTGRDAGRDMGRDAGRDTGRDAGRDMGRDAGRDTGRGAGNDAGNDARLGGLRLPLAQLTAQTITALPRLRAELAEIRTQGYAVAVGELEPGFTALAAPIYDRERQVVAAISIGGSSLRLTSARHPELAVLLQMAARQISRQLGFWPG
jgi:DNA-binding IclR family transcriptional regulator